MMVLSSQRRLLLVTLGILLISFLAMAVMIQLVFVYQEEKRNSIDSVLSVHWVVARSVEMILNDVDTEERNCRISGLFSGLKKHPDIVLLTLEGMEEPFVFTEPGIPEFPKRSSTRGSFVKGGYLFVWDLVRTGRPGKEPVLTLGFHGPLQRDVLRQQGNLLLIALVSGVSTITFFVLSCLLGFRIGRLREELNIANRKRDQVEEMGLAAAGLAHETKNPLGIIRGLAQQIADNREISPEARSKASDILEEADITTARLGEFLNYARLRTPVLQDVSALPHLERVGSLIRGDFEDAGIEFKVHVDDLVIRADPEMLSQVVLNLLNNSLKSTQERGTVAMFLKRTDPHHAMLTVHDTGSGIAPEFLPNIFKPYSSRRSGGYGIGMAIVKKIVEESGWEIQLNSEMGKGTDVTITGILSSQEKKTQKT